jgi:hypothetical protein
MGCERFRKKSEAQLAKHIRSVAKDSSSVYFTVHVKVRMVKRKVSTLEVLECVRNGVIRRVPELNDDTGSLECRMERYVAGRELSVIVALCDDDPDIVLVTVYKIS